MKIHLVEMFRQLERPGDETVAAAPAVAVVLDENYGFVEVWVRWVMAGAVMTAPPVPMMIPLMLTALKPQMRKVATLFAVRVVIPGQRFRQYYENVFALAEANRLDLEGPSLVVGAAALASNVERVAAVVVVVGWDEEYLKTAVFPLDCSEVETGAWQGKCSCPCRGVEGNGVVGSTAVDETGGQDD